MHWHPTVRAVRTDVSWEGDVLWECVESRSFSLEYFRFIFELTFHYFASTKVLN